MNDQPKAPQRVSTRATGTPTTGQNAPARKSVKPAASAAAKPTTASGSAAFSYGTGGSGGGKPPTKGKGRKQPEGPRWKRVAKITGLSVLIGGCALVVIGFFGLGIRYTQLSVPAPDDFAQAQSSTITYSNGTTVMGRLGVADRKIIDIATLPEYVPQAFVASEDRTFYTNPGIDVMGTARALFKTVVLGHKQGGSTITQQYVERYYVGKTTTSIKGKIDEALLAYKIDNQQSKTQVLGNYMNTIYFGRGAYGIEAAARQYFGKSAADLTYSEAAMIVGIVPAPSAWDPAIDPAKAEARWNYVLDGMLQLKYITQAQRESAVFPQTIEYQNKDTYGGPTGYLLTTALNEVEADTGITRDQIESMGYTVVTTINPKAQKATEAAVAKMPTGHSPNLQVAAVTLNPKSGAILSMYGGADYLKRQQNAVTQDIAQAGSTFKPFALIAALEKGISLKSTYSGRNLMTVPGFERKVRNFNNESFNKINLADATAYSVNTVYAQVGQQVGPKTVEETAVQAGLPQDTAGLTDNAANVLGSASPHPLDMARAYATIANNGVRTEPFIISKVLDSTGKVIYQHKVVSQKVFEPDVMADTTYAMTQVVQKGSGTYVKNLNRPIAGKTGTSTDFKSAWFVGFTPSVVGAVALYQVGDNGSAEAIKPFGGFDGITGGSIPARVFTWMMAPILHGTKVQQFPARANLGVVASATPSPSVTPSSAPSPTPTHTAGPVPSVTPTPDPVPTVAPTP